MFRIVLECPPISIVSGVVLPVPGLLFSLDAPGMNTRLCIHGLTVNITG